LQLLVQVLLNLNAYLVGPLGNDGNAFVDVVRFVAQVHNVSCDSV
jgi:hypothetical protein